MPTDDSALIAAFRAALTKAREIEADHAARHVTFRLHELGVVARVEDVYVRQSPGQALSSYVQASEQIAPWRELEHARGGPGMVMGHTLERAVADIEKGASS